MKLDIRLSCTLEEFLTPGFGDDDVEYRAWFRENHPVELRLGDHTLPSELFDLLPTSQDIGHRPDNETWVGISTEHADAAVGRACIKWARGKLVAWNIAEYNR